MVALAYTLARRFPGDFTDLVFLWIPAAAAVIAALVILTNGPAAIGWAAIGYVLFAGGFGLVFTRGPAALLLLLFVAYLPMLQRPRGSLVLGLAIAIASAAAFSLYFWENSPRAL